MKETNTNMNVNSNTDTNTNANTNANANANANTNNKSTDNNPNNNGTPNSTVSNNVATNSFEPNVMLFLRRNNALLLFLTIVILVVSSIFLISWYYINDQQERNKLLMQRQLALQSQLEEKKELRKVINDALLDTRFIRASIQSMCAQPKTKTAEIESHNVHHQQIFQLIKIFYPAKLVFGMDVGNNLLAFLKLADTNNHICVDGDYDRELRKLQWKINVLIDDTLIKDTEELKKFYKNKG